MGKVDPTGFDAALATIQPGQLSERQQRIAAGVALMREQGMNSRKAAAVVGVPHATLYRYHRDGVSVKQETGIERDTEDIAEASADIALIAAEAIRESLVQHPEDWKPMDLVKAYGVATDKIIALGQKGAAPVVGIRDLFAGLLGQAEVTLKRRDPLEDAVDVSAEIG